MPKIHFKRGEFLTDLQNPNSFAIYGGFASTRKNDQGEDVDYYSLICYYNPSHPIKNGQGIWDVVSVFSADTEATKCTYFVDEKNVFWWRRCTEVEKTKALKYLAETQTLAWEEDDFKLRKLAPGEKLCFDTPPANVNVTGGSGRHTLPVATHKRGTHQKNVFNVTRLAPAKSYVQTKKLGESADVFCNSMLRAIDNVNKEEAMAAATMYGQSFGFNSIGSMAKFSCVGGRSYREVPMYGHCDEYDYD